MDNREQINGMYRNGSVHSIRDRSQENLTNHSIQIPSTSSSSSSSLHHHRSSNDDLSHSHWHRSRFAPDNDWFRELHEQEELVRRHSERLQRYYQRQNEVNRLNEEFERQRQQSYNNNHHHHHHQRDRHLDPFSSRSSPPARSMTSISSGTNGSFPSLSSSLDRYTNHPFSLSSFMDQIDRNLNHNHPQRHNHHHHNHHHHQHNHLHNQRNHH
ncbi:hypothetical protein SSS_07280 [Sarcoptes scabiei]|uniref:Uncharacterized protein n=1 Tax=Sarcoptes scabiei TaxID=52283 RepID=A0A834R0H1_SARSC|nr:hypothetical protein SSS_07280 [Sarcoptes scabiei]